MLLLLGSVVWGLHPNSYSWVMGSGHQVESCNISIRLCKGIHSPLKSDLQVSIALSARLFA